MNKILLLTALFACFALTNSYVNGDFDEIEYNDKIHK